MAHEVASSQQQHDGGDMNSRTSLKGMISAGTVNNVDRFAIGPMLADVAPWMIRAATASPRFKTTNNHTRSTKARNRIVAPRFEARRRSARPKKTPLCLYRGTTGWRNTQLANNSCKKSQFESPFSP